MAIPPALSLGHTPSLLGLGVSCGLTSSPGSGFPPLTSPSPPASCGLIVGAAWHLVPVAGLALPASPPAVPADVVRGLLPGTLGSREFLVKNH